MSSRVVLAVAGGPMRVLWMLFLLLQLCEAQNMTNVVASVAVPPLGSVRSAQISAAEHHRLAVRPKIDEEVAPAIFIYDNEGRLRAKNDENSESASFEWKVTKAGSFEVVIYSNAETTVEYTIQRLPPEDVRAPLPEDPPYVVLNVFWASNRRIAANLPLKLDVEPSDRNTLAYGRCEVSIPRVHVRGLLEGPSILRLEFRPDPEKHVVFGGAETVEASEFFSDVRRYSLRSTEKDALVFIHGFNVDFESAARRAAQLSYDLEFKGPTVVFSWPSQGSLGPLSYNKDRRNAELSADPLRDLLTDLSRKAGVARIHVIAHSMGNVPLAGALTELQDASRIHQIALLAPDIDQALFEKLARKFPKRDERKSVPRVTLYASDKDLALIVSRQYAGYRRAGQGGPDIVVVPDVVDSIDASNVDTSLLGVLHQYYADNSQILGDLYRVLRGESPSSRFGLRPRQTKQGTYWFFVPSAR